VTPQEAVPPLSDVVEEVQEVIPADPATFQVTVPVGVMPLTPLSFAVKVTFEPTLFGVEFVTTLVGANFATEKESELLPAVTKLESPE